MHAQLDRVLPGSPSAAYTQVSGQARNLETKLAGTGLVGDNLGSALDQARKDALCAELLFLFLGVTGAVLAGLVTAPAPDRTYGLRPVVGPLRPRLRGVGRLRPGLLAGFAQRLHLVLAPERVAQVSVNWYALLAPLLGWLGAGLLTYRIVDLIVVRGRTPLARLLRPLAGELSPTVAATIGRQRRLLARAATR